MYGHGVDGDGEDACVSLHGLPPPAAIAAPVKGQGVVVVTAGGPSIAALKLMQPLSSLPTFDEQYSATTASHAVVVTVF